MYFLCVIAAAKIRGAKALPVDLTWSIEQSLSFVASKAGGKTNMMEQALVVIESYQERPEKMFLCGATDKASMGR